MTKSRNSDTAGKTVLFSRILANRPMVRIEGKVYYLSTGTSMVEEGGEVVRLFENTWMRAKGVARLKPNGSRTINKEGNSKISSLLVAEKEAFDQAVVDTIKAALPLFDRKLLQSFYDDLKTITKDDESKVRSGLWCTLGKIPVEDLLLSGALSKDSRFFTETDVGKAIRAEGIKKYGIIEVHQELNSCTGKPIIVDYPEESDPDFENLKDFHLVNYKLPNENSMIESDKGPLLQAPNQTDSNQSNKFFRASNDKSQEWDINKPTVGMIILAICIPVLGWAYLVYLLFNKISDSSPSDNEQKPLVENRSV